MSTELRTASADDWRVWRAVRLAALADSPGAFGSRLDEWADASEDRWRNRLSISGAIDLLAVDVDSGTAVGMATGTPATDSSGCAELISTWVDPSARGQGVASALIAAIAHWAAENGATTLVLSVMNDNLPARRAYERNRFVVLPKPGNGVPDVDREMVMLRDLGSLVVPTMLVGDKRKVRMKTRRWFTEPLLTGLLALLLYLAWQIRYTQTVLDGLWAVVPVAAWTALATTGNWVVRKRGFSGRSLVAFLAAAALCAPVAIHFGVMLTANDGWRGLGAISVVVSLIAPFLFLLVYWAASALLLLFDGKRKVETIASPR